MKILTTSDLAYVSGSNAQDTTSGSFNSGGQDSTADNGSAAFANGIAYTLDNPYAALLAYLYQMYRNSGNYATVPYSNPMGYADGGY